jgi:hypothetical protein
MNKCLRCGNIAEVETIEGFLLCSSCESVYNNIINEPLEKRTLKDFKKEMKGGLI